MSERRWFPHLDWAGEPMHEGEFRDPFPMQEEISAAAASLTKAQYQLLVEDDPPLIRAAHRQVIVALMRKGMLSAGHPPVCTDLGFAVIRHFKPRFIP